ncbi:MAG: S6e family ribosomal protein [archaeon]
MREVELQETIGVLRMTLKLNISEKEKSWKLEVEPEVLSGRSIGDKIPGKQLKPELDGYELEITGGTDFAGFPMDGDVEGIGMKKQLFTKGWGMHSKPKGDKKKQPKVTGGLRLRKTVRGRTVFEKTLQVNMQVLKTGSKKLEEIFPDQNAPKAQPQPTEAPKEEAQPTEAPTA